MKMDVALDHFKFNLLLPFCETIVALGVTKLLLKNFYTASIQTTAIFSMAAFTTAAIAHNIFHKGSSNAPFYYGAVPFGMGIGAGLHRFIFFQISLSNIMSFQSVVILNFVLGIIGFVQDTAYHYVYDKDKKLFALHHAR